MAGAVGGTKLSVMDMLSLQYLLDMQVEMSSRELAKFGVLG